MSKLYSAERSKEGFLVAAVGLVLAGEEREELCAARERRTPRREGCGPPRSSRGRALLCAVPRKQPEAPLPRRECLAHDKAPLRPRARARSRLARTDDRQRVPERRRRERLPRRTLCDHRHVSRAPPLQRLRQPCTHLCHRRLWEHQLRSFSHSSSGSSSHSVAPVEAVAETPVCARLWLWLWWFLRARGLAVVVGCARSLLRWGR